MINLTDSETQFALDSVRKATHLAQTIQQDLVTPAFLKKDRTPVTVGDYAIQAIVAEALTKAFPDDPLVAEESSTALTSSEGQSTLEQVHRFVSRVLPNTTPKSICQWIDRGTADTASRFWTLDPIDGTKGFLRQAHYAIVLALVVDGQCQIGAMGCPSLNGGSFFIAVREQGAWMSHMDSPEQFKQITVSQQKDLNAAKVLSSFEFSHTNSKQLDILIDTLGAEAKLIRMDSQTKHVVLASGEGDLLVRLLSTTQPEYREKIWDQIAGALLIEEAGGSITDLNGKALDFSTGRTLSNNRGLVASNGYLHEEVLELIGRIRTGNE